MRKKNKYNRKNNTSKMHPIVDYVEMKEQVLKPYVISIHSVPSSIIQLGAPARSQSLYSQLKKSIFKTIFTQFTTLSSVEQ